MFSITLCVLPVKAHLALLNIALLGAVLLLLALVIFGHNRNFAVRFQYWVALFLRLSAASVQAHCF